MRVYDELDAHRGSLPGDVPRKAGATHIGIFFAWCVERALTSDWHTLRHAEEFGRLQRRWYSGRDYLLQFMDGRLADEHLTPAGRAFAEGYYVSGGYLDDYERTLRNTRPTIYHVPDTWASLDEIAPVLDERFETWRTARASHRSPPPVPVPVPVPDPEPDVVPEPVPNPDPHLDPDPAPQPTFPFPPAPPPPGERRSVFAIEAPSPSASGPSAPFPPAPAPPSDPAPAFTVPSGARISFFRRRPAAKKTPPPLLDAPHRTKRSWHGSDNRGAWIGALILFIGIVSLVAGRSTSKRVQRYRENQNRHEPSPMERHRRVVEEIRRRQQERMPPALQSPKTAPWPTLSARQLRAAANAGVPAKFENEIGMRFVLIPPGGFVMGSHVGEAGRDEGEPLHNVLISEPYYLSIAEVTNDQFRSFRRQHKSDTPIGLSDFNGGAMPVTSVGWESARDFCMWLGRQYGKRSYRLPTEAQWEYACRAGTASPPPGRAVPARPPAMPTSRTRPRACAGPPPCAKPRSSAQAGVGSRRTTDTRASPRSPASGRTPGASTT